jgi:hypothetical protein
MEKQEGMAFGFRKSSIAVIKQERQIDRKFGAHVSIGISGPTLTKIKFVTQCYTQVMLSKFVNICGHRTWNG